MDRVDKRAERRSQRRVELDGTNNYVCIASGSTRSFAADRHHIGQKIYDKIHVERIRADIHRLLSEAQRKHPKPTSKTPGTVECACHYCLGVSDILPFVVGMLRKFAADLIEQADPGSEPANSLTHWVGHYLNALAAFLERLGQRLKYYGYALADESGIAEATKNSRQKGPRRPIKR